MNIARSLIRKINFKGKGRLINLIFKIPFKGIIEYKKNSLIEIDTNELICWNIYWFGGYEDEVTWIIDKLVKQDDVVLDFGANIGVWTLLFAKNSKFVHAVEPHPEFRKRLVENLSINRLKNCEVHGVAVSRRVGNTVLFAPPVQMKNKSASILNLNSQLSEKIEVELRTMDSMFSHLDNINFIKIDCDGSDADIILSGSEIIKKHKPVILFEDLGGYHAGMGSEDLIALVDDAYDEVFDMLENLGYGMFNILNGVLKRTSRIRGDYSNILAIPLNNFPVEMQNV